MITATVNSRKYPYKVDNLVNRGEWFGETWLLSVGYGIFYFVVEAQSESDVIDIFTDSKFGHMIKTDNLCNACEEGNYDNCECLYAGNTSERINLDDVHIIGRCKVNYFAKKDTIVQNP